MEINKGSIDSSMESRKHVDFTNRDNPCGKKNSFINEQFVLQKNLLLGSSYYMAYRGVDLISKKYVTIFIKPTSKEHRFFAKNMMEELKSKITPTVIWTGTEKIDKNMYDIQVHLKWGPSLYDIMMSYRRNINEKTLYLLSYHLLKLIQRIDNSGFVHRSLNPRNVVLNENCMKNQLFFLNNFEMERKNEDPNSSYDCKYCSIGSHLKLKTTSKDTLESMCYLLIDFYLRGSLFHSVKNQNDMLEAKSSYRPQGLPLQFMEFFSYIKNLNYGEEVKFTQWKIKLKKLIPEEDYNKPYEWIQAAKQKSCVKSRSHAGTLIQTFVTNQLGKNWLDVELEDDELELDEEFEQGIDPNRMSGKIMRIKALDQLKS